MDRPVPFAAALLTALAGSVIALAQEEPAPKRQRLVSPHIAEALRELSARHVAAVPEPVATTGESAARLRVPAEERDVPANGIVRLPAYIVREPRSARLPKPEEVMTSAELARFAMRKYHGDDHEFWGRIDLGAVWQKIPVLSWFVPLMTKEQLAAKRYHEERNRERWSDAMSLLTPAERERVRHPDRPAPWK